MFEDLALGGMRVLDFGRLLPSGVATYELARMGADVVKVEIPPLGDYIREIAPSVRGRGDIHLAINGNKRSIALDFRKPQGRDVALDLIREADVMVELSRPGTMARYGLAWEDVVRVNPRLVYCSFTAYGVTGPLSDLPAHGLSADAAGGALPQSEGSPIETPDVHRAVGPWAAGLYSAMRIVAACYAVHLGGQGRPLHVSQLGAAAAFNFREIMIFANDAARRELSFAGLGPRYAVYDCRDGQQVLLCATEAPLWNAFCEAIERPDLPGFGATDYLLGYGEDRALEEQLTTVFLSRTSDEWLKLAIERSLAIAPVSERTKLHTDEQLGAIGMIASTPHPIDGDPLVIAGDPVPLDPAVFENRAAPELGEHTDRVLADLGYSENRIGRLHSEGIVGGG